MTRATSYHLAPVPPHSKGADQMHDEAIIQYWQDTLRAAGSTPKSIRERTIVMRALLKRTGKTVYDLNRHDLIRDLGRDELSASTRQNYRSLYYRFFTWLQDEELRLDNPAVRLPQVRVPRKEPNPVQTADIEYLLHSGIYRRTRMWVILYAYQGLRASEIAAVAGDAIDWNRRRILTREAKNGVEVWRPLHPIVWEALQAWPRTGWLFPSYRLKGQHISGNNVSRVLGAAFKRAGINHRPHQLRAWYASEMIDAGVSTLVTAAALRHADTQTVQKYVRVSDHAIEAAQGALPVVRIPQRTMRGSPIAA